MDDHPGHQLTQLGKPKLNIFDNVTLLKMWCETTAQAIFPQRKIGYLKESYEANFLVVDGDPIQDFKNTGKIVMRVKAGMILAAIKYPR